MIVLDLSSNDLGTIDIPGFLAAGVEGVVLGVYSANPPHDMAAVAQQCIDGGLPVLGFYGLVYFGDATAEERDIRWAIDLAQQFGVQNVWMDVEVDAVDEGWKQAPRPTPAQRVSALLRVETLITNAGLTPGVYTYRGFWESQMGNAAGFSQLPLWFASYGTDPGVGTPITTVDFGGWTDLAAHQFTSNWGLVHGCGRIHRDASFWYQEAEMAYGPVEAAMLKAVYDALTGGTTNPKSLADITAWNQGGNSLLEGYEDMQRRVAALEATPITKHTHALTAETGGPV